MYIIILGFAGSKKDRIAREHVLIWSLLVFAIIGFIENIKSIIGNIDDPVISILPKRPGFVISSVPYLLFGIVLVYYFGGYLLSSREKLQADNNPEESLKRFHLSPREIELVPLLNSGLSNREIAENLCISLSTVKTHLHRIYEKTAVKSRYELFHIINSKS